MEFEPVGSGWATSNAEVVGVAVSGGAVAVSAVSAPAGSDPVAFASAGAGP
ncbi:hypothetical protein GTX14_19350 [Streptomyces sp. SID4944]|nr:hypothetical protein [Streptomyces sp. SID4944]